MIHGIKLGTSQQSSTANNYVSYKNRNFSDFSLKFGRLPSFTLDISYQNVLISPEPVLGGSSS